MTQIRKILAYSLVELMISLIAISCITAVFVPVITKKITTPGVSSSMPDVTTKCDDFTNKCTLCYPNKCIVCYRTCNENQYKNNGTCLCENCSDRSTGCLKCDKTSCSLCASGYGLTSDGKCKLCSAGYYSDGTYDCKACPIDQYQSQTGKSSCIACPAGQGANEGASLCTTCSTKIANCAECSNLTQCTKCKAGYYLSSGSCVQCPAGYRCDGINTTV